MAKFVVFDFDGTLVDSREVAVKIYNQLAEKYNTKKMESIERLRGLPLLKRFEVLDIPFYKLAFLAADFTKQYKHSINIIAMVCGMREVLIELKRRGYQLAIVSSNSESNIRDYFKRNNLDVIETVVSSVNVLGKHKDIKKLLALHKLKPSEVIYVGDEIRDVEACKKIGIKIIWVNWGYDVLEVFQDEQPDFIASSPEDILTILP